MRGILDEFYTGIPAMIPVLRARQPREEEMKCGSQSADVRMIHRRSHLSRVAFPVRCHALHPGSTQPFVIAREQTMASLDITGHVRICNVIGRRMCGAGRYCGSERSLRTSARRIPLY